MCHPPRSKPVHQRDPNPTALLEKYAERPTGSTYRWETPTPSSTQLGTAVKFFTRRPPQHLWSASEFKRIRFGTAPEVAFLGRSNVGKSSLLNALLNKPLAHTSSKPGRTKLLNAYSVAGGQGVLLDMPGYGHNSREEWGVQVMKYLQRRRELRRAFLLVDANHGFKSFDRLMVRTFAEHGVAFQVVLSKVDRLCPEELVKRLVQARAVLQGDDDQGCQEGEGDDWRAERVSCGLGEIIGTAANPAKKRNKRVGINELRWSIMVAMGLDENVDLKRGPGEPAAVTMGWHVAEGEDASHDELDSEDDDGGGGGGGGSSDAVCKN
ncbi:P-loop containing nucleoside triphosphate hydrolase protein [Tuber magnatum]|uniref:GTP-binding protein 8 n=1 Tax=Tuber magnatum TaxID=42249 RepID=A0A317SSG4_9PEZI|nr:P-loop containing nucleoside triphosphate hydrolase protein [Tuber magnatum]